jgi:ribonucleoside-diphosphate reductase alpha chain
MNAGTDIQQLSACFVLPVRDSMDGIFEAIKHTALIHKSGGGTGFSFSRVRPRGDVVGSTKGTSSGPLSFMTVFDAATETVKQGGRRRGANMAILRVDHPDVVDFIRTKDQTDRLNNFNISVAITDRFMEALEAGGDYELVNPRSGEVTERIEAQKVFDLMVDSAWRTGEPGVVFIDRVNRFNPTPAVGEIESTNPCGEQPLLPYESCNLGSVNVVSFARGAAGSATVDYSSLRQAVHTSVRFLDNVIDMNRYPLPEIAELTRANRKIGLGVMGFADLLIRMGIPYDHDDAVDVARELMRNVQDAGHEASRELAAERGPFPNFEGSMHAERGEAPLRNATVTTIAPTGSISIIADTSSGVEPLFALTFTRRVLDGTEMVEVNSTFAEIARGGGFYSDELVAELAAAGSAAEIETIPRRWREVFKTAHDIEPAAHVRIQAAFQEFTDNAVSKTVNFPHTASREDVAGVFQQAFAGGCKGVTIYRDGSRDAQVLSTGKTAGTKSPAPQPQQKPGHRRPRPRPGVVAGETRRVETGCGNMYVTINTDEEGRPFELFAQIGKAGGCAASQTEAIGRLISLSLRAGVDPKAIAKQLRGVRCPSPAWNRGEKVFSCADGIGQALAGFLETLAAAPPPVPGNGNGGGSDVAPPAGTSTKPSNFAERLAGVCAECGGLLEFEGGCVICRGCGYSRC